jgi:hypothetical protein
MPTNPHKDESPGEIELFLRQTLSLKSADEVIVCRLVRRAFVLVAETRLTQVERTINAQREIRNRLGEFEICVMTRHELESRIERAIVRFESFADIKDQLPSELVGEGLFSAVDIVVLGANGLARAFGLPSAAATEAIKRARTMGGDKGHGKQ